MPQIKKINFAGQDFIFETNPKLFSPNQLDAGSRLLLENIKDIKPGSKILDIGCGWGAMGIILAKLYPQAQVTLLDNDPLAIELTKTNIALNQIANAKTFKADVTRQTLSAQFDLVIANPPWNRKHSVMPKLISFALNHLEPSGKFYMVVNQTFKIDPVMKEVANQSPYKILLTTG